MWLHVENCMEYGFMIIIVHKRGYREQDSRRETNAMNVTLTEKEVELVKMSIKHCLETCEKGGPDSGCEDCEALKAVLAKLESGPLK